MRRSFPALTLALAASVPFAAHAEPVPLPPTCAVDPLPPDDVTPLAELRARVEALAETDPTEVVRLLCATIPRVARETGEDSVELAWWVGSLATPLIAYMDKHAEALPLLDRAQAIFERRLGKNAEELADIHVAHAWIAFRQGRLNDAGDAWRRALAIRELHPGPKQIELQKALVGLSLTQLSLRDFAGARASLDRALAILEHNDAAISEAAAAIENSYTNLALREEDYAEARRHAERQIEIERQLSGGAPQLVPAHVLLGRILERLDEFEAAEATLREAIRLSESDTGPLQRHHLSALTQLAALLETRGRPEEALGFARRAHEVGEATLGPEAPWLVRVLSIEAEIERTRGELPESLRLYERAGAILALHEKDIERPVVVGYLRGLGLLQLDLGDVETALQTLDRALEAAGREPTLATERARVLLSRADAALRANRPGSRGSLDEALTLFRSRLPESHPTILEVLNALCGVALEDGTGEPEECAEAARRIEDSPESEPGLRQAVFDNQSRLAERRGEPDTAYAFALRGLAAAAVLGTPDPLWRADVRVAHLLRARDDRTLAIFFGKRSIAEIERMRGYFRGDESALDRAFLTDKVAVYRSVADWLLEAGRVEEGLEVLRLLKSAELYDFAVRGRAETPEDRPGVELTPEEQAFAAAFAEALAGSATSGEEIDRLSRLRAAGRLSVQERERLDALLDGQAAAEASRTARLRALIAQRGGSADGEAKAAEPDARDLGSLGSSTAVAYYVLTASHVRILVGAGGRWSEQRIAVDRPALQRDIGRLLDRIERRQDVHADSRVLYDLLARPVVEAAREHGAARLVLWLDGALRYVPFAALDDGRRYLGETFAIETITGSGLGVRSKDLTPRPDPTVRGLGTTQAVSGYRALPAVADELCSIVHGPIEGLTAPAPACPTPGAGNGALPGAGFADAAFTRGRLETLLDGPRDFSVLHLGTHFSLRPGNAMRSYLVLGDGTTLTLDALAALDFHGIDLLTLSACQTGLGGATTDDGREIDGLSALVQRRGARRVVSSLWQVEDVSTALLMRAMYKELAATGDASRSLKRAQGALRAVRRDGEHPYEHPYYWAGFTVSGSAP
jgi:CHAT domain-containing protein